MAFFSKPNSINNSSNRNAFKPNFSSNNSIGIAPSHPTTTSTTTTTTTIGVSTTTTTTTQHITTTSTTTTTTTNNNYTIVVNNYNSIGPDGSTCDISLIDSNTTFHDIFTFELNSYNIGNVIATYNASPYSLLFSLSQNNPPISIYLNGIQQVSIGADEGTSQSIFASNLSGDSLVEIIAPGNYPPVTTTSTTSTTTTQTPSVTLINNSNIDLQFTGGTPNDGVQFRQIDANGGIRTLSNAGNIQIQNVFSSNNPNDPNLINLQYQINNGSLFHVNVSTLNNQTGITITFNGSSSSDNSPFGPSLQLGDTVRFTNSITTTTSTTTTTTTISEPFLTVVNNSSANINLGNLINNLGNPHNPPGTPVYQFSQVDSVNSGISKIFSSTPFGGPGSGVVFSLQNNGPALKITKIQQSTQNSSTVPYYIDTNFMFDYEIETGDEILVEDADIDVSKPSFTFTNNATTYGIQGAAPTIVFYDTDRLISFIITPVANGESISGYIKPGTYSSISSGVELPTGWITINGSPQPGIINQLFNSQRTDIDLSNLGWPANIALSDLQPSTNQLTISNHTQEILHYSYTNTEFGTITNNIPIGGQYTTIFTDQDVSGGSASINFNGPSQAFLDIYLDGSIYQQQADEETGFIFGVTNQSHNWDIYISGSGPNVTTSTTTTTTTIPVLNTIFVSYV